MAAVLAQGLSARVGRRLLGQAALLAALALAAGSGCVATGTFLSPGEPAPSGGVCQVVATWQPQVVFIADSTHGGAPTPGFAGRLYLFGEEVGTPKVGDGSASIDLYDRTPCRTGGQPVLIEQWNVDRDTLKRVLRKDVIGWGYTLVLPWATIKPEIQEVELKLRYVPPRGAPLFAESHAIALNPELKATTQTTCTPLGVPPLPPSAPAVPPGPAPAAGGAEAPTPALPAVVPPGAVVPGR
jgi:hypothetical protein